MSDGAGAVSPWGAVAQGVTGLIGSLIAAGAAKKQRREGNRILRDIGDETVPQEIMDNQNIARQIAGQGLPSAQYNQAMRNIQRQQLMALRGSSDRRGGLSTLGSTQQAASDALLNLDAADAAQKIQNQQVLLSANRDVGQRRHDIWERKYNYAQQLIGAGNSNKTSALDRGAAGLGGIGYGLAGSGIFGGGAGFEPKTSLYNPRLEGPI